MKASAHFRTCNAFGGHPRLTPLARHLVPPDAAYGGESRTPDHGLTLFKSPMDSVVAPLLLSPKRLNDHSAIS